MSDTYVHNPLESPERPDLVVDLHDGTNEQVSVIVVHHEKPEYLNICLQSIHVMSNLNNFEMIVVDNASGPETQEYLDVLQAEGVKVVRNQENLYWSEAANLGVAAADKHSKYLLFMHSDTVVLNQGWIDLLVNISEARSSGMVGTQLGAYLISKQRIDFVQEWCVLMTRNCWNDIGPWPEELPMIGHSFIMTIRAQTKGYKPQAISNNIVHHFRAISYKPNELEKMSEKAMTLVPRLMQQIQAK